LSASAHYHEVNAMSVNSLENLIRGVSGRNHRISPLKDARQYSMPAGRILTDAGFLLYVAREVSHAEGGKLFVGELFDEPLGKRTLGSRFQHCDRPTGCAGRPRESLQHLGGMLAYRCAIASQQDMNRLRRCNRSAAHHKDRNRRLMDDVSSNASDLGLFQVSYPSGANDQQIRTALIGGDEQTLASIARANNRLCWRSQWFW
jgi:hypothetical protein